MPLHKLSSPDNVFKRDAILAPVAKQWIAKDIPSYGSQTNRAKIAIHSWGQEREPRKLELFTAAAQSFLKIPKMK